MKQYLLDIQQENDTLWESYLEWVTENKDVFSKLPKNIQDEIIEGGYYEE